MTAALAGAALQGVRQVSLSVTAGNAGAIGLYQTLGFKVFGTEPEALLVCRL